MMSSAGDGDARFLKEHDEAQAALQRLARLNPPGDVSLAGAYVVGYAAVAMAAHDGDDEEWFDALDPIDLLVLGATFPNRFADASEFANVRDAWLRVLRGTVHWKGIEGLVRAATQISDTYNLPVDDPDLMLLVAARLEAAHLDQRKLPRAMLPETALAGSRVAVGPPDTFTLPDATADAAAVVDRFWKSTDVDLPHDGTAADALREGIHLLAKTGMDVRAAPVTLLAALYGALVARDSELVSDIGARAGAWAYGLDERSPLIPVVDTILVGADSGLTTDEILGRLHGLAAFTETVRKQDRVWHSSPGQALRTLALELGYPQVVTRDRTTIPIDAGAIAALRELAQRFEEKFGRPPGPDDPVLFDPHADEPTPISPLDLERSGTAMLEALGISPAWIYANQHTDGLLPLPDGTFRSDKDRTEWEDALARYQRTHPGVSVDHDEQMRKLRTGLAATSLGAAKGNPEYAASLIERMHDSEHDEDYSDAHLARDLLRPMAADLLDNLARDRGILDAATEYARAWGGATLATAVITAIDDDPAAAPPGVLLAAFAATRDMGALDTPSDDDWDDDDFGYDFDLDSPDICEELVEAILESGEPDLPRQITSHLLEIDDQEESGRLIALLIGRAMGCLISIRDAGVTPDELEAAITWIAHDLAPEYAGAAAGAASLAGHPESTKILATQFGTPEVTVSQLAEALGEDFFPAMIWLCTGLAATLGDGDPGWLHQHRTGS